MFVSQQSIIHLIDFIKDSGKSFLVCNVNLPVGLSDICRNYIENQRIIK
jgi:hypothetical protein